MHSDSLDRSGSPRKRMSVRGTNEEESLRHFIQEAEETPKRLLRRDSRYGSFRRGDTPGSQSEEESVENTAVMELQADYEACLEELRSMERHQDVLLFQLDCLHDALEGAEETLADTQRENKQLNTELEHEKEQRRKLEVTIQSLVQEVERLKEEERIPFTSTCVTGTVAAVPGEAPPSPEAADAGAAVSTETPPKPADPPASSAAYIAGKFVVSLLSKYVPSAAATPRPPDPAEDNEESSRYEDAPCDFPPGSSTPDGPPDWPPDWPLDGPEDGQSEGGADPKACSLS